MPFTEQETSVGMIAWFAIDELRNAAGVRHNGGTSVSGGRPFVCYCVDANGDLYWAPLTLKSTQPERTVIKKAWILRPTGKFLTESASINDGEHTYSGPTNVFAALSTAHDPKQAAERPFLTQDGIAAVVEAVKTRRGLLPPS